MTKTQNFTIHANIHGVKAGQVIRLPVDENGVPVDRHWRRRYHDAKVDNCMSEQPIPKKAVSQNKEVKT